MDTITDQEMTDKQAIEKIKEICESNPYIEVCGFLGYDRQINQFMVEPKDNISENPKQYFMIDPLDYILFKDRYEMVAIYHSHISGDEKPSQFDIKMAENCCDPFLIYSLNSKKINIYEPKNMTLDVNILNKVKKVND